MQAPGDEMGYSYDLGDHWNHEIRVVSIFAPEESNGRCQVLDGAGACPPEDSCGCDGMGNWSYKKFLQSWAKFRDGGTSASRREFRDLRAEASKALNYKDRLFDPDEFSVEGAQQAVSTAFRTRASVVQGSKQFTMPMSGFAPGAVQAPAQKGNKNILQEDEFEGITGPRYLQETVATRRDKGDNTLCAECGSPNNLKLCSGCKKIRFCGQTCQRAAWKAWHRQQCLNVQATRAKSAASKQQGTPVAA
ncbi:hypothetical protein WJX74_007579 [Apatococcus lobatus]|uniref:MYND-type domain-containing protein n=1 Tax=Apatococcus lobatus TaxID=904363 RepID=A0AAW1R189_9CHLO